MTNRYLLHALRRHPERLRGVVVLDPWVSDAEPAGMNTLGVRSVRVNALYGGGALARAAPDRVLWGTDWPHVASKACPNTGALANLLEKWIPDERLRRRTLVDNPSRLYGFPPAG